MSKRDERFTDEARSDYRQRAQVDRDRILYSRAFARLAEVTQVVSADSGYLFHNRLTHSLKVAQIARRLAEKLIIEQPEDCEQLGERALARIVSDYLSGMTERELVRIYHALTGR